MYSTSTYFIKEQIINATLPDLLNLYVQELEEQGVAHHWIEDHTLYFRNNGWYSFSSRYNKFSSFETGSIRITDEGHAYVVVLEASRERLLTMAGIIAGTVTLLGWLLTDFNVLMALVGLVFFGLIVIVGFINTAIAFPIYFTSLRNRIERAIQEKC